MGTSLTCAESDTCHINFNPHFSGREASVSPEITSSPVENVCAWQPRWPEMPSKQVTITQQSIIDIFYTLSTFSSSLPFPTGRCHNEHKIRIWWLKQVIFSSLIKIPNLPENVSRQPSLISILSHARYNNYSYDLKNTDATSVKISIGNIFMMDSLVPALSTLMYSMEYNYPNNFSEINPSASVNILFAPISVIQTIMLNYCRETRTGLIIQLTVSSMLRCPLSPPPNLLLTPASTAGILKKAREVHASSEGLDEAQSADEDSYTYFFLFTCVCIV